MDLRIVLTGKRGVGIDGVVDRLCAHLEKRQVRLWGFRTNIKADGTSYYLRTFDGTTVPIAHINLTRGPQVGPFRVDQVALDQVAAERLKPPLRSPRRLCVVDAMGKLEAQSSALLVRVRQLLEEPHLMLLALRRRPQSRAIDELANTPGVKLIEVTPENRALMSNALLEAFGLDLGLTSSAS